MAVEPPPQYQFLPYTRRGLIAKILDAGENAPLPARAKLKVAITVTNVAAPPIDIEIYGPGDVIGVDPRLIVRTEPRPNITDFEPNYLAAIEFDFPDFPWMFTPERARVNERLRPWCVLVVVDRAVIPLPKVNRGAPLPVLTIPKTMIATELPDLEESYAWAHVQVVSDNPSSKILEQEMASQPILNVSRLMCPRRLQANHRYVACLVPAFDLGVQRGLGLIPQGATLAPAWDVSIPPEAQRDLTLPVYFHWEFATGPAGDFESLARKLTPIDASGDMGFQSMFVGSPMGGLPNTPAGDETSYLKMEGVLRAIESEESSINNVDPALRAGLRKALHAPGLLLGGNNQPRIALSPPIYGEWHLNHHRIPDSPNEPEWMRELNLDPRARGAAGLGGEVIRANQEDFMHAAWEQVGEVIKANEFLNRARFALDVHRRTYQRHYLPLPQDRLLQMTSALHPRTLVTDKTVKAQITVTSLPDASVDPALRRLASPQRSWRKSVARRKNFASAGSRSVRSMLIPSIAAKQLAVDPVQFLPDSIVGAAILDELQPAGATQVDLSPFGIQARVEVNNLKRMQATRGDLVKIPVQNLPNMKIRTNLETSGVIVKSQLEKLGELQAQILEGIAAAGQAAPVRFNVPVILSEVTRQVSLHPNTVGILINAESGAPVLVHPLTVDTGGNILLNGAKIANLAPEIRARGATELRRVLTDLRPGTLAAKRVTGDEIPTLSLNEAREVVIAQPPVPPLDEVGPILPPTVTLPPPVRDTEVIRRFKLAFGKMAEAVRLATPDPLPAFVAFSVKTARDTLLARLNPDVMVVRRVRSMIGGEVGDQLESLPGVRVLPTFDRIMVAPEIAAPMYSYLANYDRERFLPGIGQLPADSITLLETNPRFIEAFMVGLNYEMNRELLWREYPSDQRGTVISRFWDQVDGSSDLIAPIHKWKDGKLGVHLRGGSQIVLLVRGQLLRRYPNTMIYAWRSDANGQLKMPPQENIVEPIFLGAFDPDVSFAGFPMTGEDLTKAHGWLFVLQEQPTEPRFGFDEDPEAVLDEWPKASWIDVDVLSGGYLKIKESPLNEKVLKGVKFGKNSAHMAFITLQKPMRVAIHGKHMHKA
jgi:hypothetical protein